jgi:hypothetical protein
MENDYVLDENEKIYDKEETIEIIKGYLIQNEALNGQNRKPERAEIVVKMFKFLTKIQIVNNFINKHHKFKETTILKAFELREETDFPEVVEIANRFLKKMGYDENRVE